MSETSWRFELRFAEADIPQLAGAYCDGLKPEERKREDEIETAIASRVREAGALEPPDFLAICRWKTPRSQPRCQANDAELVREVTRVALSTPSERLRIEVLTLLDGVEYPTASVILHWCHREPYPILDFRALWSLGVEQPPAYDFAFWQRYTAWCRELAQRSKVTMRTLDRALWQHSREHQARDNATPPDPAGSRASSPQGAG